MSDCLVEKISPLMEDKVTKLSADFLEFFGVSDNDEFYVKTCESWKDLKEKNNIEGLKNLMAWVSETFSQSLKDCYEECEFKDCWKYSHEEYLDAQEKLIEDTLKIKDINKLESIIADHVYNVLLSLGK